MRLVIDSLVALMLAGILAAVVMHNRAKNDYEQDVRIASDSVRTLQREVMLQATLEDVDLTERGWPATVNPKWFAGSLPDNPLIGPGHPWVEVAGWVDRNQTHPDTRIANNKSIAKFWYNPHNGTVRARVPSGMSDSRSLALYNTINGCNLSDLFAPAEVLASVAASDGLAPAP